MTFPSHLQQLNGSLSKGLRSLKVYIYSVGRHQNMALPAANGRYLLSAMPQPKL